MVLDHFFGLAPDGDSALGRGPDRFPTARRERLRIREGVGEDQSNRPDDVAMIESLLRRTGDLDFRPATDPTGVFSALTRDAIRQAQRRNRRPDSGRIAPDDEMLDVLADEAAERERAVQCTQLRIDLANLQDRIDRQVESVEEANTRVVTLSDEAEGLRFRHNLQIALMLIPAGAAAVRAIRLGRAIIAALREFVRSVGDESGQFAMAVQEAEDLASRFEDAVDALEDRLDALDLLSEERRRLVEERQRLSC